MTGTPDDWAALWVKGGGDGPRPSAKPPPLVEESIAVPCERDDCRGKAGFARCSTRHQKCRVCDRVTYRPEEQWGTQLAPT